jgi:hypothetical protein
MILVCMPVSACPKPHVRSRMGRCGECGTLVWVAGSSPRAAAVCCVGCVVEDVEGGKPVSPLTARQLADIKRYYSRDN